MQSVTYNDSAMQGRTARLRSRLTRAMEHAITAPSGHNAQPWKFRLLRDGIELLADRVRSLPLVDPLDRELTISCGAALHQFCLAMNHDSLATLVHILPDSTNPDLLARVRISGPHQVNDDDRELFAAMPRRHTNRSPFDPEPIPSDIIDEWYLDAKGEKCWLYVTDEAEKKQAIADLVTEGDRIQASDKAFRRELAKWCHANRSEHRDGMPGFSHGVGQIASYLRPLMIRTFDWGDGQAAKDRQLAEGSPLLAVIGTDHDTPAAWMACGQALMRMLLRGTACGLNASFLNQPIEVEALRPQLAKLLDNKGSPQILLRWGNGPEVKSTPRRKLADMLVD